MSFLQNLPSRTEFATLLEEHPQIAFLMKHSIKPYICDYETSPKNHYITTDENHILVRALNQATKNAEIYDSSLNEDTSSTSMNFEYTSSSNSTKNGANNNAKTELMEDVIFSIMDEEKKKLNTTPISLKRPAPDDLTSRTQAKRFKGIRLNKSPTNSNSFVVNSSSPNSISSCSSPTYSPLPNSYSPSLSKKQSKGPLSERLNNVFKS